MDGDIFKAGDLVFLTRAFDEYVRRKNAWVKPVLTNRIAKIEEIIDWESEKGKAVYEARVKSGKWHDLPIKDSKYILSVYYHDMVGRKGQKGVAERGVVMFARDPVTGDDFFVKIPDWIYKEVVKKCEIFAVELKRDVS